MTISPSFATAGPCESLQVVRLSHTTITAAHTIAAGTFVLPEDAPRASSDFFTAFGSLREFCRIQGVIRPSNDSHIEFEVWLPTSGWNTKYVGAGNGGFSGSINYYRLAEAVNAGYAASATDAGHKGSPDDYSWAAGHPEKVVDFKFRAIHELALKAKVLIQAFYNQPITKSYFNSCSNGGRQGLTEAAMYPADYDGILIGAPATTQHLTDLKAFKGRGGRIILYHGANDNPQPTVDYYNTLITTFGRRIVEEFLTFFVIPDMGHCGGGPVPDFGTRLWPPRDAQHGMFSALERWVEDGVAPMSITATKFKVDSEPSSGVVRTRPLCVYPRQARWDGIGSEDDALSYRCEVPPSP
jgi:tannase/feruloyl esterase